MVIIYYSRLEAARHSVTETVMDDAAKRLLMGQAIDSALLQGITRKMTAAIADRELAWQLIEEGLREVADAMLKAAPDSAPGYHQLLEQRIEQMQTSLGVPATRQEAQQRRKQIRLVISRELDELEEQG
jgi:hypothetical protein